jgi:hypothetical protein
VSLALTLRLMRTHVRLLDRWVEESARSIHADRMSRPRGAAIARAAILLVGVSGLVWAVILPAFECSNPYEGAQ